MKIIQILGWYFPESLGGTEVYVNSLSHRLIYAGHQVVVVAPDSGGSIERSYEFEGIPVYRYPLTNLLSRDQIQNVGSVPGSEFFHKWLKEVKPDVIHFHSFITGIGIPEMRVAKEAGARIIVTFHLPSLGYICQRGTMLYRGRVPCDGIAKNLKCAACYLQSRGMPGTLACLFAGIPLWLSRLLRKIPGRVGTTLGIKYLIDHNRKIEKEIFDLADKVVFLNEKSMEIALANGAPREKLILNRLGVDSAKVTRKPGPDISPTKQPIKIGYIGRFDEIKGVYDLARAIIKMPSDLAVNIEFRGPMNTPENIAVAERLRKMVKNDRRVKFSPVIDNDKVTEVLAGYDVICCPSLCLEGGPTVAMEAYAAGTPVIGSRIGGLAELVADGVNGALVEPGDWKALSALIVKIALHPASTIDRWRRVLPDIRSIEQITEEYLKTYMP